MKTVRVISSIATTFVGLVFLLLAIAAGTGRGVDKTVEHGQQIESAFALGSGFVANHLRSTGKIPTSLQFEAWSKTYPMQPYTPNGMRLERPPFSTEVLQKHGMAPENGFVLSYWRGEWEENYVSWTGKSSVQLDESAFYLFHSRSSECAIFSVGFLSLSALAVWAWPRSRHAA